MRSDDPSQTAGDGSLMAIEAPELVRWWTANDPSGVYEVALPLEDVTRWSRCWEALPSGSPPSAKVEATVWKMQPASFSSVDAPARVRTAPPLLDRSTPDIDNSPVPEWIVTDPDAKPF